MNDYQDLKHYLPPIHENTEEAEERRHHSRDTSCCAFLFLILLLTVSVYVINVREDVETEFWLRQKVINSLGYQEFSAIVDQGMANAWITNTVANALFSSSSTDCLLKYYDIRGPVVMRQVRSQESDCLRSDLMAGSSFKCFYTDSVGSHVYTQQIGTGPETWRTFQASTDFQAVYTGEFGDYATSGYVIEFTRDYNASSFAEQIASMNKENWISDSTRALFIACNMYQPSYDLWVVVSIVLEYNTNRLVYPSQFDVVAMQPDLFQRNAGAWTADIFRIIFSLYILYLYVFNILEIRDGHRNIKHIMSFQGLMDLVLVASVIFSVIMSLWIIQNEKKLYEKDVFKDLEPLSLYYRFYNNINSTSIILIIVRILLFLTVNKRVYVLITTIQLAAKNIVSFITIFLLLILAFSMVSQSIWGTQEYLFHNFTYSVLDLLLITLGHGNFESMIYISEGWSVVFLLVYFLFVIYFFLNAFMGIYMEAYRIVRMQDGYNDNDTTWAKTEILMWFVDWLPYAIKRKMFASDNKNKKQDEDDDDDDDDSKAPEP